MISWQNSWLHEEDIVDRKYQAISDFVRFFEVIISYVLHVEEIINSNFYDYQILPEKTLW